MDANSSIIEDFQEFTSPTTGLIAPMPHGGSGNGVLYTAIAVLLLKANQCVSASESANKSKIINSYVDSIYKCFIEPGLLSRGAGSYDQEGPDDYIGACTLPTFAVAILKYGKSHWFNYNNVNPGKITKSSFMLRQPQLIAHMYYGAYRRPNIFLRLYWSLAVIYAALTTNKTDQDGWMLTWLLVYNNYNSLAAKIWRYRVNKVFGNQGLKNLNYLNNGDHPITKWWVDINNGH